MLGRKCIKYILNIMKFTLGGQRKILCAPEPRRNEQWPHKRLSQTCLWQSSSLPQRYVSKVPALPWGQVYGIWQSWHKFFWRRSPSHYPYHSLAFNQTTVREHSLTHQEKIDLKMYLVPSHPSEQDPDAPTASPSHQEVPTSLLSLFIRGQT